MRLAYKYSYPRSHPVKSFAHSTRSIVFYRVEALIFTGLITLGAVSGCNHGRSRNRMIMHQVKLYSFSVSNHAKIIKLGTLQI